MNSTVGILGAGVSGLAAAIHLQKQGIDDFVIYDRHHDVGGTWLVNTYPGLHCDIPSHLYGYSFEPFPDWSMVHAPQAEIQAYLRRCAERYGLVEHIRFGTDAKLARLSQDNRWQLETDGGPVGDHQFLIQATGGLTAPKLPRIDGLDRFSGDSWHSATWRHDVELTGRRVAVVGSAASAVQVVPHVAANAAEVTVYSRSPNWVIPRNNREYTDEEKAALADDDNWYRLRRKQYHEALLWYRAHRNWPGGVAELRRRCLEQMHAAIDDPEMISALTPPYDPGCTRLLLSDDYYPALAQPHVEFVPQGVTALTETGVVASDGEERPADVVIFCTGYRVGARADGSSAIDVVGSGGIGLADVLSDRPEAYWGVAIPGFPNYFTVCGINGTLGYTPVTFTSELHAEFIAAQIRRAADDGWSTIEARREAADPYNESIQAELAMMSWAGPCRNFYVGRSGRNTAFFPGTFGRLRRQLWSDDTLAGFDFRS